MAGTISASRSFSNYGKGAHSKRVEVVTIDWTADASDATVPSLSLDLQGYCIKAITNPGATAPTANYDIALGDPEDSSLDALAAALANRATATTEQVYPAIAGSPGTVTSFPPFLAGTYSLAISNNAVNSATGRIILYLVDSV